MTYCPNPNCNVHPIFLKHRSIPYHTRFWLNVRVRTCILCGAGPCRAQNSMCKKKFEVVGGRADVPQDPAMAEGAAHSIRDCTPFLAKPNQQGGRAYLPEPTLQTPCYTFLPQCQFQAITKKTSLLHILSQPRGYMWYDVV